MKGDAHETISEIDDFCALDQGIAKMTERLDVDSKTRCEKPSLSNWITSTQTNETVGLPPELETPLVTTYITVRRTLQGTNIPRTNQTTRIPPPKRVSADELFGNYIV